MEKLKKPKLGGMLKTYKGRWSLLGIFVVIIILSSFFASMLATNWGKVNIHDLSIDSEGAIMAATIYTPIGINANDKLPAVIITHGIGCAHTVQNGTSEELARRGFVVLSVSAYGSGLSETSETVEGTAPRGDNTSPTGLYDALLYLRTLKYVDQTRIGMTGHSQGSRRTFAAASLDASYFTLNDLMINFMNSTYGISFTKDDINLNADTLASSRLNADQMKYYNAYKDQQKTYLETRMRAVLGVGDKTTTLWAPRTVKVAGNNVTRVPYCNGGFLISIFNEGSAGMQAPNLISAPMKTVYQTGNDAVKIDQWYQIQQYTSDKVPNSKILGGVMNLSIKSSPDLAKALDTRTARIFLSSHDTHSENFESPETTTAIVKFFEQALKYNNGELLSAATVPIDATNSIFMWREALNCLALIAMFCAIVPLAAMLCETKFFSACKFDVPEPYNSKKSWPFWVLTAAFLGVCVWAIWGKTGVSIGPTYRSFFFQQDFTVWGLIIYTGWIAAGAFVLIAGYKLVCVLLKRPSPKFMQYFHLNIKFSAIAKTFVLAGVIFTAIYASMCVLKLFFNEDYRIWTVIFSKMNAPSFMQMLRWSLLLFPMYLSLSAFINTGRMKDMGEGWNTLLNVVIGTIGPLAVYLISYGAMWNSFYSQGVSQMPMVAFVTTINIVLFAPIIAWINRRMYTITGSIWLGAFLNTLLIAWGYAGNLSSSYLYLGGNNLIKWLGIG